MSVTLPFAPLWQASGAVRLLDLVESSGYAPTTVRKWAQSGVPLRESDRLACKGAGVHPATVWPDWFVLMAQADCCGNGHDYTEENSRFDATGRRHCRACHRDRQRARWRRINQT